MIVSKQEYVAAHSKSRGVSLVLTLLFGPLGLCYSSLAVGIILTLVSIASAGTIVIPIGLWISSVFIGDFSAIKSQNIAEMDYNLKFRIDELNR